MFLFFAFFVACLLKGGLTTNWSRHRFADAPSSNSQSFALFKIERSVSIAVCAELMAVLPWLHK